MEHKTLYHIEDATLTALAVLPVERAVTATSAVLQTSFSTAAVRLSPGEELRTFLYLGTADGAVLALRCTMQLPAGVVRPEHRLMVEPGARAQVSPPPDVSDAPPLPRATTFLHTSRRLPLLFALAGGTFACLRCADLQPTGPEYKSGLLLPPVSAATALLHGCAALAPSEAAGESDARERLALSSRQDIYLVECTRHRVRPVLSGEGAAGSMAALHVPPALGAVEALGWQADTVLAGTPTAYLAFSAITGQLLQRMDVARVRDQRFTPFIHSMAAAWPASAVGWQSEWAALSSLARRHRQQGQPHRARDGARRAGGGNEEAVSAIDATADTAHLAWTSSLLFRTPDGVLRVLDGRTGVTGALSEAPPLPLAVASPLVDAQAVSPFLVAYRLLPARGRPARAQYILQSGYDGRVWAAPSPSVSQSRSTDPSAIHTCGGDDDAVVESCPDSVVEVDGGERQGLVATPMGVLAFGPHTVEAVVLKPAADQLRALVAAGQYATAVVYLLMGTEDPVWAQPAGADAAVPASMGAGATAAAVADEGRSGELDVGGARDTVSDRRHAGEAGHDRVGAEGAARAAAGDNCVCQQLRELYRRCATHALASGRYEEAFTFFTRARTPVQALLRLFPELHLPPPPAADRIDAGGGGRESAVAPLALSYPDSEVPYRALHDTLMDYLRASTAPTTDVAAQPSSEAAAVEFALFLLYVLDRGSLSTADSLLDFFSRARRLPLDLCLRYVGAGKDGDDTPPPYPRPDLVPLLLAAAGRTAEALAGCRRAQCVSTAAAVLRIGPAAPDYALHEEHLPWMLRADAAAAMAAVLDRRHSLPPPDVVVPVLIGRGGAECLYTYLAFQLYVCGSRDPYLHTLHATNLIDMVQLIQTAGGAEERGEAVAAAVSAAEEAGLLGRVRRALLQFLADDGVADYDTDAVLTRLRAARLYEEQVVVLHRTGDDPAALQVLAYDLDDTGAAVHYCLHAPHPLPRAQRRRAAGGDGVPPSAPAATPSPSALRACGGSSSVPVAGATVAEPEASGSLLALPSHACLTTLQGGAAAVRRRLHVLLRLLLVPPLGMAPRTGAALDILSTHAHQMDAVEVLACLPGDVSLSLLAPYLTRSCQTLELDVSMAAAEAAAAASVVAEVESFHVHLQQRCVRVDSQRCCAVCQQPVREREALAVFPNLKVTHFCCHRDGRLDPERGVPFRHLGW